MSTSDHHEPLRDQLQIWVSDTKVEIIYRGRSYLALGISESGDVRAAAPRFSDVEWFEDILHGVDYRLLDVLINYKEPTEEAVSRVLPRRLQTIIDAEKPSLVVSAARRGTRRPGGAGPDSIAEHPKMQVLNDLLDTMIDDPDHVTENNIPKRVEYTRRISQKHHQRFFAVAGVRAALTKGVYGDLDWLLDRRRSERASLKARELGSK